MTASNNGGGTNIGRKGTEKGGRSKRTKTEYGTDKQGEETHY